MRETAALRYALGRMELRGPWRQAAAWLGELSYALYITHMPAYELLGVGAVAALLDRVYDRPVRRWLARRPALRRR
ncbi:hypothetical protein [Falsiroseomonas sp. HW251]|uniref:hypothetical protein n=1 Tax=Falsiroseomonas sp. HW251 TaxID=3390998 RepID=UPI003D31CE3F